MTAHLVVEYYVYQCNPPLVMTWKLISSSHEVQLVLYCSVPMCGPWVGGTGWGQFSLVNPLPNKIMSIMCITDSCYDHDL